MTKNNNFIEEVENKISPFIENKYNKIYLKNVRAEGLLLTISDILQESQKIGIEEGIKKQLEISKIVTEKLVKEAQLKAREELKKEIMDMIEDEHTGYIPLMYIDIIKDKIKNIDKIRGEDFDEYTIK
jgi:hypothetical protein